jgi:hypothetical protein
MNTEMRMLTVHRCSFTLLSVKLRVMDWLEPIFLGRR